MEIEQLVVVLMRSLFINIVLLHSKNKKVFLITLLQIYEDEFVVISMKITTKTYLRSKKKQLKKELKMSIMRVRFKFVFKYY